MSIKAEFLPGFFLVFYIALSQFNLRHTFCTTCQMYVRQEIVDIWMGDAPERLIGRHYTHFPDEFMLTEMNKVIFEV